MHLSGSVAARLEGRAVRLQHTGDVSLRYRFARFVRGVFGHVLDESFNARLSRKLPLVEFVEEPSPHGALVLRPVPCARTTML